MVFGLTQWFVSFVIFLIVLSVITWSAVHLGKKEQNSTDTTVTRFNDPYDDPVQQNGKLLRSMIIPNSISRPTRAANIVTLFASEQGSEVHDIKRFYEIMQALSSTKPSSNVTSNVTSAIPADIVNNNATAIVNNDTVANNGTAGNGTTRETDITIMHSATDKPVTLNDRQNVSGKAVEPSQLSSQAPQITQPSTTRGTKLFDLDKLRRVEKNGMLNASVAFSFVSREPVDAPKAPRATRQTTETT